MNSDWRILRWALLAIALGTLSASLLLPASQDGFPFILPYLPMVLVVLNSVTSPTNWSAVFLIVPLLAFLASPFLSIRRPRGAWSILWLLGALMMLGIWMLPPASARANTPLGPNMSDAWFGISYGYYLYAAAHTIAFLGCIMAPPGARPPSRKRGFPVVVPNENAEQSQSS